MRGLKSGDNTGEMQGFPGDTGENPCMRFEGFTPTDSVRPTATFAMYPTQYTAPGQGGSRKSRSRVGPFLNDTFIMSTSATTTKTTIKVTNNTALNMIAKVWNSGSIINNGILNLTPGESGSVDLNSKNQYILGAYTAQDKHKEVQKAKFSGTQSLGAEINEVAGNFSICLQDS
jgi:hypothetical protein